MSRKTNNKWKTDKCGRCGEPHSNYTGKLDSKGIEYVVCGRTGKRMNVSKIIKNNSIDTIRYSLLYCTNWEKM